MTIQAQYLDLLRELQEQTGVAIIFVTHNLGIVARMCDKLAVMYAGKIVEAGSVRTLFNSGRHPYTKALLSAVLPPRPDRPEEEIVLAGEVPSPLNPPGGCRFHTRCPFVMTRCRHEEPMLLATTPGQLVACHLHGET